MSNDRRLDQRTRNAALRMLAQRDMSGRPAYTHNTVANRFGMNVRTLQRIMREHHCSNWREPNE